MVQHFGKYLQAETTFGEQKVVGKSFLCCLRKLDSVL